MNEKEIVDRCRNGDLKSFDELYALYKHKALGTAYLITGDKSTVEDIVQEAFIVCYHQIKKLKNPEAFNIWFYRTLVRIGWRMSSKNKNHVSFEEFGYDHQDFEISNCMSENDTDKSNDRLIVREAIKKLSPPLRNTVILYYFSEMTIKEILKIMGCFPGTVKSRLHKARNLLKRSLKKTYKNDVNTGLLEKNSLKEKFFQV